MSDDRRREETVSRLWPMFKKSAPKNGKEAPATIDPAQFRKVMARFATGVTVITAQRRGEVRGMTANGFMSGSLEPPLCIVSVAKRARMHKHLIQARAFGVNILAHGQHDVSAHFAGKPLENANFYFTEIAGVPLLKDAAANIAAKCIARHDCGDHSLFIGHIFHMASDNRPPLLVHGGRYGSLMYSDAEAEAPVLGFW